MTSTLIRGTGFLYIKVVEGVKLALLLQRNQGCLVGFDWSFPVKTIKCRTLFIVFRFRRTEIQILFVPLQMHLPSSAMMSFEKDGANGWSTTLRNKRHCTLCFWWLERRKLKPLIKDNGRGDAYGCVYCAQPECAEGLLCPHAHFWVHCIYSWGYQICSFY